jgi:S1-C subfamily serine protease
MIVDVYTGSPAAKAGIRRANQEARWGYRIIPVGGDIIFQIDNTPVGTIRDILDYISDKKNGDSVTLHYYRGKAKKSSAIKLTLPPDAKLKST